MTCCRRRVTTAAVAPPGGGWPPTDDPKFLMRVRITLLTGRRPLLVVKPLTRGSDQFTRLLSDMRFLDWFLTDDGWVGFDSQVVSVFDCQSMLRVQIPDRADICFEISALPDPFTWLSYNGYTDRILSVEVETTRERTDHRLIGRSINQYE